MHMRIATMRTSIEIDDEPLVRIRKQVKALAELEGLGWEGDLDAMRQGRPPRANPY
jgi:Arc/MetJ family transcription regulator